MKKLFYVLLFTGSFCETIKWWINSDIKMPPEEVLENYQKMIFGHQMNLFINQKPLQILI